MERSPLVFLYRLFYNKLAGFLVASHQQMKKIWLIKTSKKFKCWFSLNHLKYFQMYNVCTVQSAEILLSYF